MAINEHGMIIGREALKPHFNNASFKRSKQAQGAYFKP